MMYIFTHLMVNSADSDQLASSDLDLQFANAGHIRIQQTRVNIINMLDWTQNANVFLLLI